MAPSPKPRPGSLAPVGVGSILCAICIGDVRRRLGTEEVLAASCVSYAAAMGMLAYAGHPAVILAAAAVAGTGWVAALTTLNIAMQLRSPDAILGRCLRRSRSAAWQPAPIYWVSRRI